MMLTIIWDKIFEEGTPKGMKPIGLAARDTSGLKWVIVFMEMILMILLHRWNQGLAGSPNSPKILWEKKNLKPKKQKEFNEN